jgi:hypothetical protein
LKIVNSISRPDRIFETSGSQPALILCDDFNYYVCKYNRQSGVKAVKLFHEFLAGSFAKLWNLAVPEFCLVNVNPSHIEGHEILQPVFFKTLCFGSKYNNRYSEIDEFYADMTSTDKRKFELKYDFLKIGLFDIWLANEDRNFNNYNLLIDVENKNRFIPIDHDAIFNTGNLHRGLVLLSENESLINTDLTKRLFTATELRSKDFFKKAKNDYYLCVTECEINIDKILQNIPIEWKINSVEYQNLLHEHLFNKEWTDRCFNYFKELIQLQF